MLSFDWLFDTLGDMNWLGVVLGTLVMVVLGALWWGPIFGKRWAAAHTMPLETKPPPDKIVATVIYTFVLNIGLGYWQGEGFEHALVLALLISVFFLITTMYAATVWGNYPRAAFMIDWPFWLVGITLAAWVQGLVL